MPSIQRERGTTPTPAPTRHTHPTHTQGIVVHTSFPPAYAPAQRQPPAPAAAAASLLLDDGTGLVRIDLAAVLQNLGACALEGLERGNEEKEEGRRGLFVHVMGMDLTSHRRLIHRPPTPTGAYAMAVGIPSPQASSTDAACSACSGITAHQCLSLSHDPLRETLWVTEVIAAWTQPEPAAGEEGVGLGGGGGIRAVGSSSSSSLAW